MTLSYPAYDVLYGFCALALALLLLYRLPDLLRAPTAAGWSVEISIASTAVAFGFATPLAYQHFDAAIGVPNAATLVVYGCILTTAAFFQSVIALWTLPGATAAGRGRVLGSLAGYAVVVAVMVLLFELGDTGGAEHPIDFDAHFAATRYVTGFLILYYLGFATAMSLVALMTHRYAALAGRTWLMRGLRWIWIGALFALAYCALKVVAVLGITAGAPLAPLSSVWAPACASLGALMIGAGLTMPSWGPRVSPAAQPWRRFLAYGRLYPLWKAMYQAMPEIALDPASSSSRWAVRDLRHRLYRRVIEIRDGRLALSRYLVPGDGDDPAGANGTGRADDAGSDRQAAAAEAVRLAAALRAKHIGAPGHSESRREVQDLRGGDLAAEVAWLVEVSRAFGRVQRAGGASRTAGQAEPVS